jgi:hypothetical protein
MALVPRCTKAHDRGVQGKINPRAWKPDTGPMTTCQQIRGQDLSFFTLPIRRCADCLPRTCQSFDQKQPRKRPFVPRWSPEPISTEISLPVEMLEGIELWAAAHSIPRSRAIRLLVYRGLAHVGMPQTEAAREAIR